MSYGLEIRDSTGRVTLSFADYTMKWKGDQAFFFPNGSVAGTTQDRTQAGTVTTSTFTSSAYTYFSAFKLIAYDGWFRVVLTTNLGGDLSFVVSVYSQ